jgi:hypothetical protein
VRYHATDVYTFLKGLGCSFDGERYPHGQIWLAPGDQIFILPDPDKDSGEHWLDAEVLDDNLKDRWVGFKIPLPLTRY